MNLSVHTLREACCQDRQREARAAGGEPLTTSVRARGEQAPPGPSAVDQLGTSQGTQPNRRVTEHRSNRGSYPERRKNSQNSIIRQQTTQFSVDKSLNRHLTEEGVWTSTRLKHMTDMTDPTPPRVPTGTNGNPVPAGGTQTCSQPQRGRKAAPSSQQPHSLVLNGDSEPSSHTDRRQVLRSPLFQITKTQK